MASEIPLVATRLLADNRDLFDRFDRADSEASFRLVIALPVLLIVPLLAWRLQLEAWGCAICAAIALLIAILLLVDGGRKRTESNDAIYQAVFVGKVEFPAIEATLSVVKDEEERRWGETQDARRVEAEEESRREQIEREFRLTETAAQADADDVRLALRGGAGYGPEDDKQLTSVHVDLTNDTTRPVVITALDFEAPLMAKHPPSMPLRLAPQSADQVTIEVLPISAEPGDLSGGPLTRLTAVISYRIGDRRWKRDSHDDSRASPDLRV